MVIPKARKAVGEDGQASFEAALAVPLLLFFVFAIIQVGWTAFATADMESGISHMEQSVGELADSSYSSPEAAGQWVKDTICENATVLDPDKLTVENVVVSDADRSSSSRTTPTTTRPGGFSDAIESAGRVHITCTVSYDNSLLFPVPGGTLLTSISRKVDATENARQEFEVR